MEQNEPVNAAPESAAPAVPAGEITKDDKTMAMLCHLLGFLTSFIGPLVIWLIKKDQSTFVNEQGKEALNFQITVAIAMFVASLLAAVCIGFLLMPAIGIADLVLCIMACIAANKGEHYRYPFALRLIK